MRKLMIIALLAVVGASLWADEITIVGTLDGKEGKWTAIGNDEYFSILGRNANGVITASNGQYDFGAAGIGFGDEFEVTLEYKNTKPNPKDGRTQILNPKIISFKKK